jgi:hypothetical protein
LAWQGAASGQCAQEELCREVAGMRRELAQAAHFKTEVLACLHSLDMTRK